MPLSADSVLTYTRAGLYCPAGDFYIDPWLPVDRSVLTHGHSDHARPGNQKYYCALPGEKVVRPRLGDDVVLEAFAYREPFSLGDALVSFHPAGHVLGSAQVRIEVGGEVWCVSGDFKRDPDPTCEPFEVVPCDVWISESTFGLPVYHWIPTSEVALEIVRWKNDCGRRGKSAVLGCYALGKAQRIAAELAPYLDEPIYTHGAVENVTARYRESGIALPPTIPVQSLRSLPPGSLVLAPPAALHSVWANKLGKIETGFASGWMAVRGNKRRQGYDRSFVVSDHADWPSLIRTARETGAKKIFFTHGFSETVARYLREQGCDADVIETRFEVEVEA